MMIYGPLVTECVIVVETRRELDPGAYWNLDFDGTPLGEGEPLTLLYARVAYPTLKAARAEFAMQQDAQHERQRIRSRRRLVRGTRSP